MAHTVSTSRSGSSPINLSHSRFVSSLLLGLCFLAVTVLAYRRLLHGWFVADDFRWLEISNIGSVIGSLYGPWGHGAAYRPFPRITYLLDFWAFGFFFPGWIVSNFVMHSLNCVLLYRLGLHVVGTPVEALCLSFLFCIYRLSLTKVSRGSRAAPTCSAPSSSFSARHRSSHG